MVFAEFNFLFQLQFISIHFSVETVVLFKHTCQGSYPRVDSAPVSDRFARVDFGNHVFEMGLAVGFDGNTLVFVRSLIPAQREREDSPAKGPTA